MLNIIACITCVQVVLHFTHVFLCLLTIPPTIFLLVHLGYWISSLKLSHLYCQSWLHLEGSRSGDSQGQRQGKREWVHPGCRWWPGCKPSALSSSPVCTSLSAHHTSPEPPPHPSQPGKWYIRTPDTQLQTKEQRHVIQTWKKDTKLRWKCWNKIKAIFKFQCS